MRTRILLLLLSALPALPATAQDICFCPTCFSAEFDRFTMMSGSMKPTLEPGQCVIARMKDGGAPDPVPGDIVIARKAGDSANYIWRLVAIAGQTVQMNNGLLVINGTPVTVDIHPDYRQLMMEEGSFGTLPRCPEPVAEGQYCAITRYAESLPNSETYEILDLEPNGHLDTTPILTVPEGHVFLMGDNRDNAFDSRVSPELGGPGFVPLENILGVVTEIRPMP